MYVPSHQYVRLSQTQNFPLHYRQPLIYSLQNPHKRKTLKKITTFFLARVCPCMILDVSVAPYEFSLALVLLRLDP